MGKTVLNVDGMSCEHCVNAIKKAVRSLPGVSDVTVEKDIARTPLDKILYEIEEQGYYIIG